MLARDALTVLLLTTGRCFIEVEGYGTANNGGGRRQLSQVSGGLSARPWQAFRDTCQDEYVELSLWVDTHLYLVSKPSEEGKDWCNEILLFHDAGDEGKAVMIHNEDSLVKDFPDVSTSSLMLSESIPLLSVLQAFDQVKFSHSSGAASYDVVINNCASLILEMLKALDIEAKGKVAEYTTSRLLENGKTILGLRSSPYKSKLLQDQDRQASKFTIAAYQSPDDNHLSDEELMTRLVNHYIESQRSEAICSQDQETPVSEENPRKRYLPLFQQHGSIAGIDEATVRARLQRTPLQLHRYLQDGSDGTCSLCADGSDPDFTLSTEEVWVSGVGYTSCASASELVLDFETESVECANSQVSAFARCGCPTLPALHPQAQACSLCQTPSYEINLNRVIPEFPQPTNRDPFTCFDVQLIMQDFPAASCPSQESGGLFLFCGCPNVPVQEDCSLCLDGAAVPNPSLEVVPGGTCQDIVDLIDQGLSEQCAALQATAGVYCGCEANDPNSEAFDLAFRSDACRVCPDRQLLPDPTIAVEFPITVNGVVTTSFTSCGQVEYTANAFDVCDQENTFLLSAFCQCDATMPSPTMMPVEMPNGEEPTSPDEGPCAGPLTVFRLFFTLDFFQCIWSIILAFFGI